VPSAAMMDAYVKLLSMRPLPQVGYFAAFALYEVHVAYTCPGDYCASYDTSRRISLLHSPVSSRLHLHEPPGQPKPLTSYPHIRAVVKYEKPTRVMTGLESKSSLSGIVLNRLGQIFNSIAIAAAS
jgi:hypothetical protein